MSVSLAPSRCDEFDVPVVMQIVRVRMPGAARELAIPALIVIVARVQRLVQVADQVQQELKRDAAAPLAGRGILELGVELLDLVDHAVVGRALPRPALPRGRRAGRGRRP